MHCSSRRDVSKFVSHRANLLANQAASKQLLSDWRCEVISLLACPIIYAVSVHSFVITSGNNEEGGLAVQLIWLSSILNLLCLPCRPVSNISLLISCFYEALSQMSTSVVEVWQPEDADPLVPLQVNIIYLLLAFVSLKRIWEYVYEKKQTYAAKCMNTCVIGASLLCLVPPCN